MKSILISVSLLILLASSCAISNDTRAVTGAGTDSSSSGNDRVLLRSITALIFSENGRSRSRYGAGEQQLQCVGGSASGLWWFTEYYPHAVQCQNIGWDGASIQWSCEGNLSDQVEFGPDTAVTCEPYDEDQDDGYILKGSCRLEYTINFKKFHMTFVHIIYACVLILGMLWCYYQSRWWLRRRFRRKQKKRERRAQQSS
ncbi:unnamed protein product [Agarophyton chilense]|eukprot:gb/GEZJ01004418.1/.p1 GENE.gb/GEZJ01004418.1/~~gb/GEZJ01004418.1/.p1  ORF type:complete len:200 (-),score=10.64 gb/GEZJ01004418.1/:151-750(-)